MVDDSKNQLERIFHEALERETPSERSAYLDGACGDDLHLRARVDVLLKAHAEADEFLEESAIEPATADVAEGPGSTIDQYKLLQNIGEGGMGVVYMAEQQKPVRRKVALKIIKLGMDTKQVIARFEVERQALAMMDHPNIAKVLGAGSTETGRPYFVMELVRGVPISEYCDTHNLSTRERLHLFIDTCHAIQHAHQKGIIHRDIKPSNVLVTSHDGRPVPKIIDFGIAKATNQRLTEKTLFTEFSQFIGTPEYMSPEQAEMSGLDVDTRSDVYSLGVLLYHLLTGETPVTQETLRQAGYENMQRLIREQEATAPSTLISKMGNTSTDVAKNRSTDPGTLQSSLRGDLDWIVMKALEKDRTRRYETVASMAEDVERHLSNLPVQAGPPSTLYKLKKFVRRNRASVVTGGIAGCAILIGLAAAVAGFLRAQAAAAHSRMVSETLQDLLVSVDPGQASNHGVDVERLLGRAREAFGEEHATVAATLNNLATQLSNAGDTAGAKPLFEEAMRLWEKTHGREHTSVALVLGQLGEIQRVEGNTEQAEASLREALSILERTQEKPNAATHSLRKQLADLLELGGAHEEAIELYELTVAGYAEDPQAHRHHLLQTREELLQALISANHLERALEVVATIYREVRAAYPEESFFRVSSAIGYANMLARTGRAPEAEGLLREALELMDRYPHGNRTFRLLALDRLFQIMRTRNDPEGMAEADELLARCVTEFGNIWTPEELLANIVHLCERLRGRELRAQALEPGLQALDVATENALGAKVVAGLRDNLAVDALLVALDANRPRAEYERAAEIAERLLGEEPESQSFVLLLGALSQRLDRPEEALDLLGSVEGLPAPRNRGLRRTLNPVKAGFEALAALALDDRESARVAERAMTEGASEFDALGRKYLEPLILEVRDTLDR